MLVSGIETGIRERGVVGSSAALLPADWGQTKRLREDMSRIGCVGSVIVDYCDSH